MLISRYDAKLNFGESGAFGSAGTVVSANVIQMDKADPGRMAVNFRVTVAAAGGTNATFVVQGSNDNSTWVTVEQSAAIAEASLTAGANFSVGVPQGFNYKYMRAAAITTGTHTAGKFDATLDVYQGA
ncbi:MAG: hypothetical protein K6D95_04685 [Treponema sp.]|nr:hypothetical protein [Treponema sp.]